MTAPPPASPPPRRIGHIQGNPFGSPLARRDFVTSPLPPLRSPQSRGSNKLRSSLMDPLGPPVNYAFLSSPLSSRFSASHGAPPAFGRSKMSRPYTSAQVADIRPGTDWTFLMSGPRGGAERVRRPWPEYQPETAAAVGRSWTGFNMSMLHENRTFSPRTHSSRKGFY